MMVTLKMRTRMETAETVIMRVRSRVICSGVTTAASTAAVAASCVSALTACSSGLVVSILPVSLVQGSECPSAERNSVSADVCPAPRLRSDCPLCRGVPVRDRGPRHHRPAAAAAPQPDSVMS